MIIEIAADSNLLQMPFLLAEKFRFRQCRTDVCCHIIASKNSPAFFLCHLLLRRKKVATFSFDLRIHITCSFMGVRTTLPVDSQLNDRKEERKNSKKANPKLRIDLAWRQPYIQSWFYKHDQCLPQRQGQDGDIQHKRPPLISLSESGMASSEHIRDSTHSFKLFAKILHLCLRYSEKNSDPH